VRAGPPTTMLLLLPGVGFLALLFGLPLLLAVLASLGLGAIAQDDGFPLRHYLVLFDTRAYRDGIAFSVYLSVVPTLVSLALALPLAIALQASFPGKRLFQMLYKLPLVVPTVVAAFIVMIFLDRGGMLARVAQPLGLALPKLVRDEAAVGVIIAMAWKAVPLMALIIAGALASVPADLRHAARTLGGGPATVLLRVDLPLALPGITAATLLAFVTSTGAFAIPSLLGPIYPQPLSIDMYEKGLRDADWGLASAMGTVLSVVACVVLLLYYRVTAGMRRAYGGEAR
jgi:putative spermidine/putrescine transport system permease protein